MNKINFDLEKFKNISFNDTLNYKHIPELEKSVAGALDELQIDMNTLSRKKVKLSQDQRMAYFLRMALLYITTDGACIKSMEENNDTIDNDYLHVIIKKHYFKMECNMNELVVQ